MPTKKAPQHFVLPRALPALRAMWSNASTYDEHEAIYDAIRREGPRSLVLGAVRRGTLARGKWATLELRLLTIAALPPRPWDVSGEAELDSCMEMVWMDLVEMRSKPLGDILRKHARSRVTFVRVAAGKYLASLALDRDLPLVLKLLNDRNSRVVGGVLDGIESAQRDGRLSSILRQRLWVPVQRIVTGKRPLSFDWNGEKAAMTACGAIKSMDAKKAAALLTSKQCLHPRNRSLRAVLLGLTQRCEEDEGVPLPRIDPELIWPVFEAACANKCFSMRTTSQSASDYTGHVASMALVFAAAVDPSRAAQEAKSILKSGKKRSQWLTRGAREALDICRNIPSSDDVYYAFIDNPSQFSKPVREIMHAFLLADYMKRDGFDGYFTDSGNDLKHALAGLKRLNLSAPVPLLKKGAAVFGPPNALATSNSRFAASKALTEADYKKLARIGEKFNPHIHTIIRAVERVIAADPDSFRPKRRKR